MFQATRAKVAPFVSVGSKLVAGTIVVVAIVAVAVFGALSRHERRSLLASKEKAALMVAQLYGDSLSAPLVFNDEAGVKEVIAILGRNTEVIHASVWPVDAHSPSRLGRSMAVLDRGALGIQPPASARESSRTEVTTDWVLVETGVVDPGGKLLGVAQVALSLARENSAIHAVEQRVLMLSSGTAILLTLVLVLLARQIIVRPLARLAKAAKSLEVGQPAVIDAGANDEVGSLARALQAMTAAIENREHRLRNRNRDMRLVLDNVEEGFVMLDASANMSTERSRILDEWFGPPPADGSLASYLDSIDETLAAWFRLGWEAVTEDVLPLDVAISQLPKSFSYRGRSYAMAFRPILDGSTMTSTMLVITDVTERLARERSDRAQREIMTIFRHVMRSRVSFAAFYDDALALMAAIDSATPDETILVRRLVHTLKGNAAQFGVETVASACHEIESRMSDTGENISTGDKARLRQLWGEVVEPCMQLAQGRGQGSVDLDAAEYERFFQAVRSRTDHGSLISMVASWQYESAARVLERISDQMRTMASQLGRAPLEIECKPTALRLPPKAWAPFWSVFTHVTRNMVDHGVEVREVREAAGKPPTAKVALSIEPRGSDVILSISDDGPGLAWEVIAAKARAKGLPTATQADLIEAIFTDGVSSRDEVTTTSGRGVGMAAVRAVIRKMGGRIELDSQTGKGTTFRFVLPRTMLGETPSLAPRALSDAPMES